MRVNPICNGLKVEGKAEEIQSPQRGGSQVVEEKEAPASVARGDRILKLSCESLRGD